MIPIGFWRWPVLVWFACMGALGVYRVKGGPVRYYRAEAVLKTVNPAAQKHDLLLFGSAAIRREIASALGWIKPQPSAAQLAAALAKLAQALTLNAEGTDRVRLSGIGKDAAGIAWVVNTAAKTTVACSEHTVSPTPWRVMQWAQPMPKPWKVEGWNFVAMGALGGAVLGFGLFGNQRKNKKKKESAAEPLQAMLQHLQTAKAVDPEPAPIPLEVIEPKPLPVPVPTPVQTVPTPAPVPEPEPLSPASLFKAWKALATPLYASPTLSIPKTFSTSVDALMAKTLTLAKTSLDPLLRYLAASCAEETILGHVVHVTLITLLWSLREGLPEEDMRTLMWVALVHDMGLKQETAYELLRFPASRSRESAGHLLIIHGMDENFKALLAMIVSKLGGKQGMQPAITPQEEKAEQLARLFTRLDRKEKILRRGAVQLAKRRVLKKAV